MSEKTTMTIDGTPIEQQVIINLLRRIDKNLAKILELLEAKWGPIMR